MRITRRRTSAIGVPEARSSVAISELNALKDHSRHGTSARVLADAPRRDTHRNAHSSAFSSATPARRQGSKVVSGIARRAISAGAVASLKLAVHADPGHAGLLSHLGVALHLAGDLRGAEEHYAAALAADSQLANVHSNLGGCLRARGDVAGAVASYRRALELDAAHAKVATTRACVIRVQL